MSNLNVTNIQHESGAGDNLILAADGTTTIPGGTNRPKIVGYQQGTGAVTVQQIARITNAEKADFEVTNCNYSRIGQTVLLNFYCIWNGDGKYAFQDETAWIRFTGLPYLPNDSYVGGWGTTAITNDGCGGVLSATNDDYAYAYGCPVSTNTDGNLRITVTYMTDDTTWQPTNGATVDP